MSPPQILSHSASHANNPDQKGQTSLPPVSQPGGRLPANKVRRNQRLPVPERPHTRPRPARPARHPPSFSQTSVWAVGGSGNGVDVLPLGIGPLARVKYAAPRCRAAVVACAFGVLVNKPPFFFGSHARILSRERAGAVACGSARTVVRHWLCCFVHFGNRNGGAVFAFMKSMLCCVCVFILGCVLVPN